MHAEIPTVQGWLNLLPLFARVAGILFLVPLPGMRAVAPVVRVVFALGLTVVLAPVAGGRFRLPESEAELIGLLAVELALGLLLGLFAGMVTEALLLAAQGVGLQAGYSFASTIDPSSEADSNVLSVMVQLLASWLFFATGLDRQVLLALAGSFQHWPPGHWPASDSLLSLALGAGRVILETGVRLALPLVSLLVLADLAMSLAGRLNAQLPLIQLSFSLKMLAALGLLAGLAHLLPAYFSSTVQAVARLATSAGGLR